MTAPPSIDALRRILAQAHWDGGGSQRVADEILDGSMNEFTHIKVSTALAAMATLAPAAPVEGMVERVARAICEVSGGRPDSIDLDVPNWHYCVAEARAAIAAMPQGVGDNGG